MGSALLLPGWELGSTTAVYRRLHPSQHLAHRHEVHVTVGGQDLIQPEQESVEHFRLFLQPSSVHVHPYGRSILLVMPYKVVGQDIVEIIRSSDLATAVQHGTARDLLIFIARLLPWIKLVHNHLHDRVAPGGAVLEVAVAPVWGCEGQWVRPERRVRQRSHHRAVVHKTLLFQSRELPVPSQSQQWGSAAVDILSRHITPGDHQVPGSSHLGDPAGLGTVVPVFLIILVGYGVGGHLMSSPVQLLCHAVVVVAMRDKEGSLGVTAIWVNESTIENLVEDLHVVVIDSIVKGEHDHLGHSRRDNISWDLLATH